MNSRNLIIGGLVIVAVAAAIIFSFSQNAQAPVAGPSATSTPQGATSTPAKPADPQVGGPTIATTPYTVYVGFATDFGTSSAELMAQESSQVVVGYEWEALPNSPLFDSVVLPAWDTSNPEKTYEVSVWDTETEKYVVLGQYPTGGDIQFPRDGLIGPTKFKVLGISPTLRICPGDRSFSWSARFTLPGLVGLVRTPLTQELFVIPCRMR